MIRQFPLTRTDQAPSVAFERVQYQPRQRHVLWFCCCVQLGEDESQPSGVLRLDPGLAASLEESLQSLVAESPDHESECNRWRYGFQEGHEVVLGSRHLKLSGVGHFPFTEIPDKVNALIEEFVAAL